LKKKPVCKQSVLSMAAMTKIQPQQMTKKKSAPASHVAPATTAAPAAAAATTTAAGKKKAASKRGQAADEGNAGDRKTAKLSAGGQGDEEGGEFFIVRL
jgi:uncharacterized protein (DUF2147 family)